MNNYTTQALKDWRAAHTACKAGETVSSYAGLRFCGDRYYNHVTCHGCGEEFTQTTRQAKRDEYTLLNERPQPALPAPLPLLDLSGVITIQKEYCDEHLSNCWRAHSSAGGSACIEDNFGDYRRALALFGWYYAGHRAGVFTYRPKSNAPISVDIDMLQELAEQREQVDLENLKITI